MLVAVIHHHKNGKTGTFLNGSSIVKGTTKDEFANRLDKECAKLVADGWTIDSVKVFKS